MVDLLWVDLVALAAGSVIAVLDLDVEVGRVKVGRPAYGVLVLIGLLGVYAYALRGGGLPLPAWGILFFALLYLPFLSNSFVDLELTDRVARKELEELLLRRSLGELRHASGQEVLRVEGRRLRLHWEARNDTEGVQVELDVHPSLLPVTVSRPHVATVRSDADLLRIRDDIRRRRAAG